MKKKTEIFPKSHYKMKITYLSKKKNEQGEEYFKLLNSIWVKGNGKKFRDSVFEDRQNGINRTIEIVNEPPLKFKFNQIYMLPTRDVLWIYVERDDNNED